MCVIRVDDPLLAEELLARKAFARLVVGRLDPRVLLLRVESCEAAREEIARAGHPPRLVRRRRR